MGNEATKLEIQISSDQPFQPGDRIEGEVVMTRTKPLKDISGVKVRFEGGSWNAEPGDRIEREVYVDKSISLPVNEGQLKLPGMPHRFAFSFDVPEGCKSSTGLITIRMDEVFSDASLQRNGGDLCSSLTILAPPTEPADETKSSGAAVKKINNHDIAPTASNDDDNDDDDDDIVAVLCGIKSLRIS